jgi:colanic acid/amylovoran biosynthesis glycosyltransferase
MKIAYFMNSYPMTSTTFIRREIHSLEAQGLEVLRYAIRPWPEPLVDEQDRAEQGRTHYLLPGRATELLLEFLAELLVNPRGMMRALATWLQLIRNARGQFIRNTAYLIEATSLKRRVIKDGAQHLHTHFATNSAAVALLSRRLGGPRYSFTAHGPDEFENWGSASLAEKVAGASFVVAISEFCRVQLARAAGIAAWSKFEVVRCGIDTAEFAVSEVPFEENATFVCVGRLCPQKAQLLIVEAVGRLRAQYPKIRVLLVGDGESRPEIEARIALHQLQEQITLMGWRDNNEVRHILGGARALLLPSFAEGLPIVIMEALALGRPVISTFIAGIPELLDRECGWIIPAGSVDHLVRAMTAALEATPSDLNRLGTEGRRRVVFEHDLHRNAAALHSHLAKQVNQ